ncbi:MAG: hypothetical protein KDC82_01200 [Bacteroidetes bacterium]|nr:hypothetical protein [Bacteroidota bacterium]
MKKYLLLLLLFALSLNACKKDQENFQKEKVSIQDGEVPGDLKINQLQYLGSHNSYRLRTNEAIMDFIISIGNFLPAAYSASELDYEHIPLKDQFSYYGVRQIELDLYLDQSGGLYYNRKGNAIAGLDEASGIPELQNPGIKILHIPDIDFNTHNYTFKSALEEIKAWSASYPEHIPIFILLELGNNSVNDYVPGIGFVSPEPWNNAQALNTLENEILDVFERNQIITPDDVRGNYNTLNEAVLANNWPSIDESRGKVMFLHNNDDINSIYLAGNPSLENKLIFTNSDPGNDDAAFIMRNSVNASYMQIQDLVAQGYIIRTRADEGTLQARTNDYSQWNLCLSSGAHFISTDYYKSDSRAGDGTWTDYSVSFDNKLYRLNPITHP